MKTTVLLVVALLSLSFHASADRLPPDAEALQAKRDAKIAEINHIYVAEMEKLMKKAMAEGNMDAAKVIEKEIEKATPDPFVDPMKSLIGKWKRDIDGTIFEFSDEANGIHAGSTAFSVKQDPDTSVVYIKSAKWVDTVTFSEKPGVLNGKNSVGATYTLQKIR